MGRSPCCSKVGLNRGTWTAQEDRILTSYIKVHGEGRWATLPKRAGLKRCGKSCRLRWLNYLKPDVKRGNISPDEEELILKLHRLLGNRWSLIAGRLPGRTDNEIKNYLKRKCGKKKDNPPSPQADKKGPSTATEVLTKATRPEVTRPQAVMFSTKLPLINSNAPSLITFDLHQNDQVNAINEYRVSGFPTSTLHDDRVSTAYYYSNDHRHVNHFVENNNVDDPFRLSNFLSVENFLMKDCIGNVRSGGEYEINKNHKDMESLEMLLNAEEWL